MAATGAIALLYVINMVMSLFGHSFGFIHEGGTVGILFSLVVVTVAALNLVLDFDFIEKRRGQWQSQVHGEWYGAFGLLVTRSGSIWRCCVCSLSCANNLAQSHLWWTNPAEPLWLRFAL